MKLWTEPWVFLEWLAISENDTNELGLENDDEKKVMGEEEEQNPVSFKGDLAVARSWRNL